MAINNDENLKNRKRCVVRALLQDKVEPNEIPLEAIHASSVRMMTNFVQNPSPDLANAVIKMLDAIAEHDDSFKFESGHSVYSQASMVWRGLVESMRELDFDQAPRTMH